MCLVVGHKRDTFVGQFGWFVEVGKLCVAVVSNYKLRFALQKRDAHNVQGNGLQQYFFLSWTVSLLEREPLKVSFLIRSSFLASSNNIAAALNQNKMYNSTGTSSINLLLTLNSPTTSLKRVQVTEENNHERYSCSHCNKVARLSSQEEQFYCNDSPTAEIDREDDIGEGATMKI